MEFAPTEDAHLLLNRGASRLLGDDIAFTVHYWGITVARFEHPVHQHSFYEACYVARGEGTYTEEGASYPLRAGTVFLSRPRRLHQIRYSRDMVMLFVGFETDSSASASGSLREYESLRESEPVVVSAGAAAGSIRPWQALWEQAALPPAYFESILRQLAHALLCSFHQTFSDSRHFESDPAPGRDAGSLSYQARLFIRDNLAQPITARDVANYLYISKRHLSRLLAREGESFTGYMRKIRIEKATQLLKHRDIPIKEIADRTGFRSLHYFTRVFTKEKGVSPARFRNLDAGE